MPNTPKARIILFLALTFTFSAFFYWGIISAASMSTGSGLYVLGLM